MQNLTRVFVRTALGIHEQPRCVQHSLDVLQWALSSATVLQNQSAPPTAPLQLHHYSTSKRKDEERVSYFQKQKSRAIESINHSPTSETPPGDLIAVHPNENKASVEQVSQVVGHPALVVTRPIEWGTVIFGYEQANRYTVYDETGQPVAQLMEDYSGLKNELGRQLLRKRRSFTATVFSADGSQVIFRLRRPVYLINSTMYIEDGEGNVIGEVRQRWHPIKRNYDLYLNKSQFASISGNFLAWEFELKDQHGATLALVDRNFQGFGKELFTDAGKYVIHFGMAAEKAAQMATQTIAARTGDPSSPSVTPMALARTDVAVIPTTSGTQLAVARPLQLDERMITLAAAISIDYDFFSQHSRHGSGFFPAPLILPMPGGGSPAPEAGMPPGATPPGGDVGGAVGAGAAQGAVGGGMGGGFPGDAAAGASPGDAASSGSGSSEMHLGGDEFTPPPSQGSFGSGDGEFKWDMPSSEGGGGGEESASSGILAAIWAFITGSD